MLFNDVKGAIFDFDGTLADSMEIWAEVDAEFLSKRGIEVPVDYYDAICSMNFNQAAEYTIKTFDLSETPEQVMSEWLEMTLFEYTNNVYLKPLAKKFVQLLKDKGIKVAIATASDPQLFIPALENNNAGDLFDTYATTSEVKRGKGFPDVYDLAAKRLELSKDDCVVFEDIVVAVKGAKAGGYKTVAVYDKRSEKDRDEMMSTADYYAETFGDLIQELEKERVSYERRNC